MELGQPIGMEKGAATRDAFGETLAWLGQENDQIVVLDGDVSDSTRTRAFGEAFPERFFNLGIAESNLVSVASGLAAAGKLPLAASFAAFLLGNAYDQIRMGIAYPRLNVKLVGSHSGISVGEDGASQMAIEDLALAATFPGFTVLVPADEVATRWATRAMLAHTGPVYLRTGRPPAPRVHPPERTFEIGQAVQLRDGPDITLIACGLMVAAALEAAAMLAQRGIGARVLDMHTVKPIDQAAILRAAQETGAIVTAEEHSIVGGLGAAVAQIVALHHPVPMGFVAIMDHYAESGEPQQLFQKYGLMPEHIVQAAERALQQRA
ncbi:MAG: transketolase family protein [Anaerolineae bacterium]|nr:transketolase family protein [Anaerolineae bacterium]